MIFSDPIFRVMDLLQRARVCILWAAAYLNQLKVLNLDVVFKTVLTGQLVNSLPFFIEIHNLLV
jgi:hypothetical protein